MLNLKLNDVIGKHTQNWVIQPARVQGNVKMSPHCSLLFLSTLLLLPKAQTENFQDEQYAFPKENKTISEAGRQKVSMQILRRTDQTARVSHVSFCC